MIKNFNQFAHISVITFILASCATAPQSNEDKLIVSPISVLQSGDILCRSDMITHSLREVGSDRVLVAAHRGAHGIAPENSISSIDHAVKVGADIIELDVRLTSDKVPVLLHDSDLSRTTSGEGNISTKSWEEVSKLRLRRSDGSLSAERVPLLSEALSSAADKIFVNLDLKVSNVEQIVDVVKKSNVKTGIMFYRSDLETLSKVRELLPSAVVMPLAKSKQQALFYANNFDLEVVHLQEKYASKSLANNLDKMGSSNWLNSLGRADELLMGGSETALDGLINSGADIIQTDYPELVVGILDSRGLRPDYGMTSSKEPCYVIP